MSNLPAGCTLSDIDRYFGDATHCEVCEERLDECECRVCPDCGKKESADCARYCGPEEDEEGAE